MHVTSCFLSVAMVIYWLYLYTCAQVGGIPRVFKDAVGN